MSIGQHAWHLGVGDPNVPGWTITLGYLATSVFSFMRARHFAAWQAVRHARFWFMVGLFLLLMGINKQLDLQTPFIESARDLSLHYGFYQHHHGLVIGFIGALLLWGALSQAWLYSVLDRLHRPERLALLGLGILFVFIAARAASFQHLDLFQHAGLLARRIYPLMECVAIACIATALCRIDFSWRLAMVAGRK